MSEKQPIGLLFDNIAYYSPSDINKLCDDMTVEQAYYMVINAINYSYKNGVFNLQESEVISKSLRIMNSHFGGESET